MNCLKLACFFSHLQFQSCSKRLTYVLYLVWLCSAGSTTTTTTTTCTHSKHAYISVLSTCIILNHNTALCIQKWESESKLTKKIKQEGLKKTKEKKKRPNFITFAITVTCKMFTPAFFCLLNQWVRCGKSDWLRPKNRNLSHKAGLPTFFFLDNFT